MSEANEYYAESLTSISTRFANGNIIDRRRVMVSCGNETQTLQRKSLGAGGMLQEVLVFDRH